MFGKTFAVTDNAVRRRLVRSIGWNIEAKVVDGAGLRAEFRGHVINRRGEHRKLARYAARRTTAFHSSARKQTKDVERLPELTIEPAHEMGAFAELPTLP